MKAANGVSLLMDQLLVVPPPKYDVPKTNISGFYTSFKDIKFPRGSYQINMPEKETFAFYSSSLFFLRTKVTWTGTSNSQLTNLTLRRKVEVKKMKEQRRIKL